jgi:GNAT superfamily N-acetyltransferase
MLATVPITDVNPGQYKGFACGTSVLDEYLKRYAKGNHRKNIGKTFVLIQNLEVVGYYSLSMGSIEFQYLPKNWQSRLPKYPVPIARIGRLAVAIKAKGQGLGKFLLIDAFHRVRNASMNVAAYATIVDAKDVNAAKFYLHFGFIPFENEPLTLFLPLSTFDELFNLA